MALSQDAEDGPQCPQCESCQGPLLHPPLCLPPLLNSLDYRYFFPIAQKNVPE